MNKTDKPIVLMADDDEDDCLLAREAFEEAKVEGVFYWVEDGMGVLEYLLRSGEYESLTDSPLPSLILLDLNMPRKDGRQALREIKSHPSLQHIPVVVLTTSQEEKDIALSREMGAKSFITKPDTFNEWVDIMRSLTRSLLIL